MCEHCGCRGVEPIAELMDEHLALLELSGDVRRHLAEEDRAAAVDVLAEAARLLDVHVHREESGVFAALKEQGDFLDAVDELEDEHDSLDSQIAALDVDDPGFADQVGRLLTELSDHIDKENLGVFPVAVASLGARGWDTVTRAHEEQPSFLAVSAGV
jgi:hemerythrin-like domain-containing protein